MKSLAGVIMLFALPMMAGDESLFLRPIAVMRQHLYAGDLNGPRAISIDETRREVWIADSGSNSIGVFSAEGVPLFSFRDDKLLRDVNSIAVDPQGRVHAIGGNRSTVERFSFRGVHLQTIRVRTTSDVPDLSAMTFDAEGNLYLADSAAGEIIVLDPDLRVRRRFGQRGDKEGDFRAITDIAVARDGTILVSDAQGFGIQVFSSKGGFIRAWGRRDAGVMNVSMASGLATDTEGRVLVCDSMRHELKLFSIKGEYIARLGSFGTAPGTFVTPSDVAIDSAGRIYVVERGNGRVQVLRLDSGPTPAPR